MIDTLGEWRNKTVIIKCAHNSSFNLLTELSMIIKLESK